MFKTNTTNHAVNFGRAPVVPFAPHHVARRRPDPAHPDHANDNRAGVRPPGAAPHAAQRLTCRWRRDPATGRLVCHWQLEGSEALACEPEQPRRVA